MNASENQAPPTLLLFLKAPRPGLVKTRLAHDLGDEAACTIYRQLAEHTLAQLPPDWPLKIHFTPADALPEMQSWLGQERVFLPQPEGDLGHRLERASAQAFAHGASSVILLGADCPALRPHHLQEAAQHLTQGQAVLGPALDGGYYLLGLPRHQPEVFQDIPWSTETVAQQTRAKLLQAQLEIHELEELEDIDTLESWQRAQKNIKLL